MQMSWTLISKKEVVSKKPWKCHDCEQEFPAGAMAKNYVFRKEKDFITKKICLDKCEKYYRTKDLKI